MARPRTPKPAATPSPPATRPAGFDLATRRMAESVTFALHDPVDARVTLDAHVEIWSPLSKQVRDAARRTPIAIGKDGEITMTDEAFADSLLERAIAAVKSWDLVEDGVPLPADEPTVRRIFTTPATAWVGEQTQGRLLKVAGFFGASASG